MYDCIVCTTYDIFIIVFTLYLCHVIKINPMRHYLPDAFQDINHHC